MPVQPDGRVSLRLDGDGDPHKELQNKIAEMRKELRHIERTLNMLDAQARVRTPFDMMKPTFSTLYNWNLSLTESWLAMIYSAFGRDKMDEVMKDFAWRFKSPTVTRALGTSS